MRMADVTLRRIVKRYDDVEAIRGIDLDIADREFVVLVGPSGCGKSTTPWMIAGLEDVTDSDIMIGGDVVNDVPPKDRDIAMVFQNYPLYPPMTVAENMSWMGCRFAAGSASMPEPATVARFDWQWTSTICTC
jgi:multiple sugar transport system ATP-binding protein